MELKAQIGRREAAFGSLRPFDETNRMCVEIFVKARIEKLLMCLETIKIKVI